MSSASTYTIKNKSPYCHQQTEAIMRKKFGWSQTDPHSFSTHQLKPPSFIFQ